MIFGKLSSQATAGEDEVGGVGGRREEGKNIDSLPPPQKAEADSFVSVGEASHQIPPF